MKQTHKINFRQTAFRRHQGAAQGHGVKNIGADAAKRQKVHDDILVIQAAKAVETIRNAGLLQRLNERRRRAVGAKQDAEVIPVQVWVGGFKLSDGFGDSPTLVFLRVINQFAYEAALALAGEFFRNREVTRGELGFQAMRVILFDEFVRAIKNFLVRTIVLIEHDLFRFGIVVDKIH